MISHLIVSHDFLHCLLQNLLEVGEIFQLSLWSRSVLPRECWTVQVATLPVVLVTCHRISAKPGSTSLVKPQNVSFAKWRHNGQSQCFQRLIFGNALTQSEELNLFAGKCILRAKQRPNTDLQQGSKNIVVHVSQFGSCCRLRSRTENNCEPW